MDKDITDKVIKDEEKEEQVRVGQHFTNGFCLYRVIEVGNDWARLISVPYLAGELSVSTKPLLSGALGFKKY